MRGEAYRSPWPSGRLHCPSRGTPRVPYIFVTLGKRLMGSYPTLPLHPRREPIDGETALVGSAGTPEGVFVL